MSSIQLFPEVRDKSNVSAQRSAPQFLPFGVEGWAGATGDAVVGTLYLVDRPSVADAHFGSTSSLAALIKFLLGRGVPSVYAVASAKGITAPVLADREAAWEVLESLSDVRLRMTDDTTQATLAALATSAENADLIYNKQIAFGGLAAGVSKSTLLTAAAAMASKRMVLAGPGAYDINGNLLSGNYLAGAFASAVSQNPDITDDLDLLALVNLTGIELASSGLPLFSKRVTGGTAVNDFEDLLQGGVSPAMTDSGQARITHLRTTWTGNPPGSDTSFDSVMTTLIIDQLFLDVKAYCTNNNFLRKGNTDKTRADLAAGISALLAARNGWLIAVTQSDGTLGYNVSVTPTADLRGVTVHYEGTVVRGVQTIDVDASLTIPV